MKRKDFLKVAAALPVTYAAMKLTALTDLGKSQPATEKMPVLFVGHGNPMNAITDNIYRRSWEEMGKKLNPPSAILCISAHWLTRGTFVTMAEHPETIHDFGGFPQELFQQEYPAPGAVDYAKMTIEQVKTVGIHEDYQWGLDHGAWCVLKPMFPDASIPVYQLSLDYHQSTQYHFNLARQLAFLRHKGVLIVASGNVVHNLRMMNMNGGQYDWALEFDQFVKTNVENNTPQALVDYQKLGQLATLAHPTNDHYLPLLYALALRDDKDKLQFFNDSFDLGSVSMRSMIWS